MLGGALAAGAAVAVSAFVKIGPTVWEAVVAFRASVAAMSAAEIAAVGFSRGLALLAGPAGLILAAVSGFLLFRKGAEDAKPMENGTRLWLLNYARAYTGVKSHQPHSGGARAGR